MSSSILSKTVALAFVGTACTVPSLALATCSDDVSAISIYTLPYTINNNGSYCLEETHVPASASLAAISIAPQVTDVILDLNSDLIGEISGDATDGMYFLSYDNTGGTPTAPLTMTLKNGSATGFKKGVHLYTNTSGTAHLTASDLYLTDSVNGFDISGFDSGTLERLNVTFAEESQEKTAIFGLRIKSGGIFTLNDIAIDMRPLTTVADNSADGIRIEGGSSASMKGSRVHGSLLSAPDLYDTGISVFSVKDSGIKSDATIFGSVIEGMYSGVNIYYSTALIKYNLIKDSAGQCITVQAYSGDVEHSRNKCL